LTCGDLDDDRFDDEIGELPGGVDEMVQRDVVSVLLDDSAQTDPAMRADLTVRVAALFDFYVSEEYVALRRALCD